MTANLDLRDPAVPHSGRIARLAGAALALACGTALEAQQIEILTTPAWRTPGSITGVVTGVNSK